MGTLGYDGMDGPPRSPPTCPSISLPCSPFTMTTLSLPSFPLHPPDERAWIHPHPPEQKTITRPPPPPWKIRPGHMHGICMQFKPGEVKCVFDSYGPTRRGTHWNIIAWKAKAIPTPAHVSTSAVFVDVRGHSVCMLMTKPLRWWCRYNDPIPAGLAELKDVCVCICEWKSKAEAPGAAVIRHQSRALWTASAYDSLPPPSYLLPLSSYSSPSVKMRDIFKVMRCLLHFRQRQGGGEDAHARWWGLIWDMHGKGNSRLLCTLSLEKKKSSRDRVEVEVINPQGYSCKIKSLVKNTGCKILSLQLWFTKIAMSFVLILDLYFLWTKLRFFFIM